MRVTYLHHSAFWVELAQSCWLFDAYERPQSRCRRTSQSMSVPATAIRTILMRRFLHGLARIHRCILFWQSRFAIRTMNATGSRILRVLRVAPNRSYAVPDGSIQTLKSTDAGGGGLWCRLRMCISTMRGISTGGRGRMTQLKRRPV